MRNTDTGWLSSPVNRLVLAIAAATRRHPHPPWEGKSMGVTFRISATVAAGLFSLGVAASQPAYAVGTNEPTPPAQTQTAPSKSGTTAKKKKAPKKQSEK